ncbi:hypothetical protein NEOKW01_1254 [Nematocida sp. AWRm80]|nr:hypothetical protein NEOKW01_1254 [Nematocida sp. AWRm80]
MAKNQRNRQADENVKRHKADDPERTETTEQVSSENTQRETERPNGLLRRLIDPILSTMEAHLSTQPPITLQSIERPNTETTGTVTEESSTPTRETTETNTSANSTLDRIERRITDELLTYLYIRSNGRRSTSQNRDNQNEPENESITNDNEPENESVTNDNDNQNERERNTLLDFAHFLEPSFTLSIDLGRIPIHLDTPSNENVTREERTNSTEEETTPDLRTPREPTTDIPSERISVLELFSGVIQAITRRFLNIEPRPSTPVDIHLSREEIDSLLQHLPQDLAIQPNNIIFTIVYYIDELSHRHKVADPEAFDSQVPVEEALEDEGECSICLEGLLKGNTIRRLQCKHIFHNDCVSSWITKYANECPLCRIPPVSSIENNSSNDK